MFTRRQFMQTAAAFVVTTSTAFYKENDALMDEDEAAGMPDEGEPHKRTWMAFGASEEIWGKEILPEAQRNLAAIALAIADYEPVSMLVREEDYEIAEELVGSKVELVVFPIDDLWMRDTGPVFVTQANGSKAAINFNFNGWGEKQDFDRDSKVAGLLHNGLG